MEWYLTIENLKVIVPTIISVITGGLVVGITLVITRAVVKNRYEEVINNRLNELNNHIVFRYKQKVVECTRLRQQLVREKALRKSAVELLSKVIGGLK